MIARSLLLLTTLVATPLAEERMRFGHNPGPVASSRHPATNPRAGQVLQALWGGRWWAVRVVALTERGVNVHYLGWSHAWDEVVCLDRLQLAVAPLRAGDDVWVEWGHRWWRGRIKRVRAGDRFDVTYPGWDDVWDETVSRVRIRCD